MAKKGLNLVGDATPIRGFVLEVESETTISLNKYIKIRGVERLSVKNIVTFDKRELAEEVNADNRVLNKKIKAFTKGRKFYVREGDSYLFETEEEKMEAVKKMEEEGPDWDSFSGSDFDEYFKMLDNEE